MSVLTGLNLEKCKGFLSPGAKQTVRSNEVHVSCGVLPLHVLSFFSFLSVGKKFEGKRDGFSRYP